MCAIGIFMCLAFVFTAVTALVSLVGGIVALTVPKIDSAVFSTVFDSISFDGNTKIGVYLILQSVVKTASALVFFLFAKYIRREQREGTPCTHGGAREVFRHGILSIFLPLGAALLCNLVSAIIGYDFNYVDKSCVIEGVYLLFISYILDHAADLSDEHNAQANTDGELKK